MANIKTTITSDKGLYSDKISQTEEAVFRVHIPTNLKTLTLISGSTVLGFPSSDGTLSQSLITNGVGGLYFGDISLHTTSSNVSTTLGIFTNHIVFVDATSASLTLTLPNATSVLSGTFFHIKKMDGTSNTITLQPFTGSQLIDSASNQIIRDAYVSVNLCCFQNNWYII